MTIYHVTHLASSRLKRKSITSFRKMYIESSWAWENGYDSKMATPHILLKYIKR